MCFGFFVIIANGCNQRSSEYGTLEGLRVLAIQADPPALEPPDADADTVLAARFSALVYTGGDADALAYSWSWCPLPSPSSNGYACLITRDELQATVNEVPGGDGVLVPEFDLGRDSTARLEYPLPPPMLQGMCAQLKAMAATVDEEAGGFGVGFDCGATFPVQVRLELEGKDGATVVAIKELRLIVDSEAASPNSNPELASDPQIGLREGDADAKTAMAVDTSTPLKRELEYVIDIAVTAESREPWLDENMASIETLSTTWFVQGGEVASTRTSDATLDRGALQNYFETPTPADYPDSQLEIIAVIRDDRGGVNWQRRQVTLED